MPVYRYRNLTTNETFELEQRITAPALTQHPETGDPVKRLIQPVGIAFKGSGFYVNDSRPSSGNGTSKPGDKPEKAAKPEGAAKTDTSSKPGESKASESKAGESKSKPERSNAS